MLKKSICFVLMLSFSMLLSACAKKEPRGPQDDIIGRWQETSKGKEKLEFRKNGDLLLLTGEDVQGILKYSFIDNNKLKVTTTDNVDETIEISINGNELRWNINNPTKLTTYKKIR